VILVGPPVRAVIVEALSRVCRVLSAGTPIGPNADIKLSDALAVLLPLELPATSDAIANPLAEVQRRLKTDSRTEENRTINTILDASLDGAEAVREVLRTELQRAFVNRIGETMP
jgi:hypothetical protein